MTTARTNKNIDYSLSEAILTSFNPNAFTNPNYFNHLVSVCVFYIRMEYSMIDKIGKNKNFASLHYCPSLARPDPLPYRYGKGSGRARLLLSPALIRGWAWPSPTIK